MPWDPSCSNALHVLLLILLHAHQRLIPIVSFRNQRARPIIIDPGLYHTKKSGVFWAKERRSMPASFKLFMGTPPTLHSLHLKYLFMLGLWAVMTRPDTQIDH